MDVSYLPDQVLAQAVQNPNGQVPGYLALAELQKRQKLRQGGAAQSPSATIAQQVLQGVQGQAQPGMATIDSLPVAKSPQQAPGGIASMAQQQPAPQQQQPAPAPGMKCGGIVKKMASGGRAGGSSALLDPWADILSPQQHDVPMPDQTTWDQAQQHMQSAYGPGIDTSEEVKGIRRLRDAQLPMTNQQTLLRAALALMGTPGNGAQAFSSATLGALGAQQESRQTSYDNQLRADQMLLAAQERQQSRADHITDASNQYLINDNNQKDTMWNRQQVAVDRQDLHAQNAAEKLQKWASDPGSASALARQAALRADDPNISPEQRAQLLNTSQSMYLAAKEGQTQKQQTEFMWFIDNYKKANPGASDMQAFEEYKKHQPQTTLVSIPQPDGTLRVQSAGNGSILPPNALTMNGVNQLAVAAANAPGLDKITQTTYTGSKYIDGSALKGNVYAPIFKQAMEAGIPVVSKDVASMMNDLDAARMNQDSMLKIISPFLATDASGRPSKYINNTIAQLLQSDPTLASLGTFRNNAIQSLRAVAGSKGLRINQSEIKMAIDNDIPKMTDTLATAQMRLHNLSIFMGNIERAHLAMNRSASQGIPTPGPTPQQAPLGKPKGNPGDYFNDVSF